MYENIETNQFYNDSSSVSKYLYRWCIQSIYSTSEAQVPVLGKV